MSQRVLIVDDSAVARVAVARRVRAAGREVVEHDSVASTSSDDPSTLACALLDFDLGDGFGVDVAARFRAENEALPIAFFTSTSTSDVAERAAAFGPVFAKPDELDAAIDWIERHSR
jgi:FixJ family two-component response regulator